MKPLVGITGSDGPGHPRWDFLFLGPRTGEIREMLHPDFSAYLLAGFWEHGRGMC